MKTVLALSNCILSLELFLSRKNENGFFYSYPRTGKILICADRETAAQYAGTDGPVTLAPYEGIAI